MHAPYNGIATSFTEENSESVRLEFGLQMERLV
jgi:hypothetical protein